MLNPCKHSQHTNTTVAFIRLLFFWDLTYACIMQGCFVPCLIVWRLLHVSHLDFEHQTCYAINYCQTLSWHFCCCLLRGVMPFGFTLLCLQCLGSFDVVLWSSFHLLGLCQHPRIFILDESVTLISWLHSLIGIVVHLSSHFLYLFFYWESFLSLDLSHRCHKFLGHFSWQFPLYISISKHSTTLVWTSRHLVSPY